MTQPPLPTLDELPIRERNIAQSPKQHGSAEIDSIPYLRELGVEILDRPQAIQFFPNAMVVCDNVSKRLIRDFAAQDSKYTNDWLDEITDSIQRNIQRRGRYRRPDMPHIVQKYFDDMYRVMKPVSEAIRPNGRFILVVGDSLIADTYLPTDLLLARIGQEIGLKIEKIEKARNRRSGQIRTYKLRETIITLRKPA